MLFAAEYIKIFMKLISVLYYLIQKLDILAVLIGCHIVRKDNIHIILIHFHGKHYKLKAPVLIHIISVIRIDQVEKLTVRSSFSLPHDILYIVKLPLGILLDKQIMLIVLPGKLLKTSLEIKCHE